MKLKKKTKKKYYFGIFLPFKVHCDKTLNKQKKNKYPEGQLII